MMRKSRRRFITLIEFLLVIALLMVVAGLVGLNIRRAFVEQSFRSEVSSVVDTLRLAQDLMLILNSDVHMLFQDDPVRGIRYWIEVEKPLPSNWDRELKRKRPLLKQVHLVEMDDKVSVIEVQDKLDIKFLSGGSVMSKGVLSLYSDDNKNREGVLVSSICLKGIPSPIRSVTSAMKAEACSDGKETEIALQVTQDMMSEIQPKL